MNRKILLCIIALAFIFLAGCSQQQSQTSYIGAETAKQTALEAAALSEQEVSSISTDMSTRDGLDYYQVRFEAAGQTYLLLRRLRALMRAPALERMRPSASL